ncbi:hypothetical protein RND71_010823 [Anisodus tanguticus]|uniref:Transmembrane protein n=1 Tax=Anisodus tanguticus TaxID=243964 RepID=A0AAE1VIG6_9SOLA|nr:hypothetical protein RND71_010823 [Anisodus tanguticus]
MNSTIVEDSDQSSPNIELSEETFGKNYGYRMGFSLGILILFAVMAYASNLCIRSRSRNNSNVPNNSSSSSIIEFKKKLLDSSKPVVAPPPQGGVM